MLALMAELGGPDLLGDPFANPQIANRIGAEEA